METLHNKYQSKYQDLIMKVANTTKYQEVKGLIENFTSNYQLGQLTRYQAVIFITTHYGKFEVEDIELVDVLYYLDIILK